MLWVCRLCRVLRGVHAPQQVGQERGVDDGHVRDFGACSLRCFTSGVERAALDDGADVEPANVDSLVGHLGMQALQVVALRGRGEPYRERAFTDALLMTYPDSPQIVALANKATEVTEHLFRQARAAGVVRDDFTAEDLYYADVANGLALRTAGKPSRADYDRRTRFFLDSLRSR